MNIHSVIWEEVLFYETIKELEKYILRFMDNYYHRYVNHHAEYGCVS